MKAKKWNLKVKWNDFLEGSPLLSLFFTRKARIQKRGEDKRELFPGDPGGGFQKKLIPEYPETLSFWTNATELNEAGYDSVSLTMFCRKKFEGIPDRSSSSFRKISRMTCGGTIPRRTTPSRRTMGQSFSRISGEGE